MSVNFYAETDGAGRVAWVWRKGRTDRIARPVRDAAACLGELRTAGVYGAGPEAISEWFAKASGGASS